MGARGVLCPPAETVTREQAQIVRLLLMCVAWAVGQVLVYEVLIEVGGIPGADLVLPAALAIGVYVLTEDLGRPRFDRGNVRYWRGRRIDDDPPKRDRPN
jgi:hypothetical protein